MTRTRTLDVKNMLTENTHFSKHISTKQDAVNRMIENFDIFTRTGKPKPQTISYFSKDVKPQNPNNILNLAQDIINTNFTEVMEWLDTAEENEKIMLVGLSKHGMTGHGISLDVKDKKKPISTTTTNLTTVVLTKNDSETGCELTTVFPETRSYVIKAFKETYPEISQNVRFQETFDPEVKKEIYNSPAFQELKSKTRKRIERRIPGLDPTVSVVEPAKDTTTELEPP